MHIFDNNEDEYLRWVNTNRGGFVINAYRRPGQLPDPYILHRARCNTIKSPSRTNYTTTSYAKVCSLNKQELVNWWKSHSSHEFRTCALCEP